MKDKTSRERSRELQQLITQEVTRHDQERTRRAVDRALEYATPATWAVITRGDRVVVTHPESSAACGCNEDDEEYPRDTLGDTLRNDYSMGAYQLRRLRQRYAPWRVSPHLFPDRNDGAWVYLAVTRVGDRRHLVRGDDELTLCAKVVYRTVVNPTSGPVKFAYHWRDDFLCRTCEARYDTIDDADDPGAVTDPRDAG